MVCSVKIPRVVEEGPFASIGGPPSAKPGPVAELGDDVGLAGSVAIVVGPPDCSVDVVGKAAEKVSRGKASLGGVGQFANRLPSRGRLLDPSEDASFRVERLVCPILDAGNE